MKYAARGHSAILVSACAEDECGAGKPGVPFPDCLEKALLPAAT